MHVSRAAALLLAILGPLQIAAGAADEPLYLGVLETVQGENHDIPMERRTFRQVRFAFVPRSNRLDQSRNCANALPGCPSVTRIRACNIMWTIQAAMSSSWARIVTEAIS
jgi:hypothetical protein